MRGDSVKAAALGWVHDTVVNKPVHWGIAVMANLEVVFEAKAQVARPMRPHLSASD